MKNLLVFALLLNAALLAGRFWQELPAIAQEKPDATKIGDVNGDATLWKCPNYLGDGSAEAYELVTGGGEEEWRHLAEFFRRDRGRARLF